MHGRIFRACDTSRVSKETEIISEAGEVKSAFPCALAESTGTALGLVVCDGEQGWGSSHCSLPVCKLKGRMDAVPGTGRLGQDVLVGGEINFDMCDPHW